MKLALDEWDVNPARSVNGTGAVTNTTANAKFRFVVFNA